MSTTFDPQTSVILRNGEMLDLNFGRAPWNDHETDNAIFIQWS